MPGLSRAKAAALIHAETIARGELRRADLLRLGCRGAAEYRLAGQRLQRIGAARRRALAAAVADDRVRLGSTPPRPAGPRDRRPLAARVWRALDREQYRMIVDSVLAERGIDPVRFRMPGQEVWRWWNGVAPAGPGPMDAVPAAAGPPKAVAELLALPDEEFVVALLRDAWEAENRFLAHDAVVERWASTAATARAWGRYAVALADRRALAAPFLSRSAALELLGAVYRDLAVLNLRAHEAQQARNFFVRRVFADHCARRLALVPDLPGLLEGDYATRHALLADLPGDLPWAVADAAIGCEDSAACGWGWAAADGASAWGSSYASGIAEAELIGLCEAALRLLER
ncbi:hypothetical protein [Kitasatospora sp. MBT63]|uniref:hypothetical protein n=1 Tax=Kitasatospora sp. MBT63 TaxID=1444768 RepID=UPI00053A078C|nr:hypothetical protein [Kitasatospora sp. MBT63]